MTSDTPEDFVDVLRCLNGEACDFVVVGAHAIAIHGLPRATGDLDLLVRADAENAARVVRALLRFGAPLGTHGITQQDFASPGVVYQMGLPPRRIDVLTKLSGVTFDEAIADAIVGRIGDEAVRCIGLDALIANKRAAGRAKDLADVEALEALRRRDRG
jgi:hypothetical protein